MNNSSRYTILVLILIGYALILLAVLGLGWYSIKNMLQLQAITQNLYTHPFAVSNAATQMDETLFNLQNNVVKVLLVKGGNENLVPLRSEAEALTKTVLADMEVINANFLGDMNRVKELELKFKQWDATRLEILAYAEKGDHETAEHLVRAVAMQKFAEVFPHIDYIRTFALDRAKRYVEEAGKHSEHVSFRTNLLIALLAVFIMITSFVVFSRVRHLQKEHEQNLRRLMEAELALKEGEARSQVMSAELALREGEARSRQILDGLYGFIGLYTLDGVLIDTNEAPLQAAGIKKEEVLGQPLWDTYWWNYDKQVQAELKANMARAVRGEIVRYEAQVRVANDALITIDITLGPMRDTVGEITHVLGFAVDITDRKRVEKKLQLLNEELETRVAQRTTDIKTAKEEAERANHAKSEFLSRMSHELRTPLHAIIAFSDLILYEKKLEPKLKKHIQHINKAGDHLLSLIDDVLDLASIESGKLTVIVKPIKLQAVLEECYSLIKPIALDAEVSLSFETNVNYIVKANHTSLKQALLNLLSNAVKYNHQKGTVTINYEVKEDKRLRINVIDTGYGLSSKRQKKLFKPFERMGFEFSKVKGTGIGLTITQQLIKLMGGTVGVESTEGKGSNFWIELVLSDEQKITQAESALIRNTINKTQQSKHIIYVEDDPINAHLMSEIINKLTNHHLVIAKTGNEGLKLILEQQPDIVLLDINLPDMDGYEILEKMREHPQAKKIPAIAMTAKAMMDDVERGERAGFDDYIVKPARAAELLKSIELAKREY